MLLKKHSRVRIYLHLWFNHWKYQQGDPITTDGDCVVQTPLKKKMNKMTESFRQPTGAQPPAQSKANTRFRPGCFHQLGLDKLTQRKKTLL